MLEPGNYISIKDALLILPVSKSTMYRLVDDGAIEGTKVGRRVFVVSRSLEQYARSNMIRPVVGDDPDSIRTRIEA